MAKKVYVDGNCCCCGVVNKVYGTKEKAFEAGKAEGQKFGLLDELTEEGVREKFEEHIKDTIQGDGGLCEVEIEE